MPPVAVEAVMTAGSALDAAADRLSASGIPDARREAARLAEAAWDLPAGQARLRPDRAIAAAGLDRLSALVARRAAGEPLAYVVGLAGFRRLTLLSDARALIPRPETEGLVELVLERMPTGVAADVCTGSGCIALALAQEGRYDRVIGTDCSEDALALARQNAARTGLPVEWRHGDLTGPLGSERLDLLVANPPYLTTAEYAGLDRAVAGWEPALALASGADGLAITRRLIAEAATVVKPGGWLALEVDCTRAADVADLAAGSGWTESAVYQDLYGRARFVLARRSESS
jgi:release factor glutamine methyltransferase